MRQAEAFLEAVDRKGKMLAPNARTTFEANRELCCWLLNPLARWAEAAFGESAFDDAALGYAKYCMGSRTPAKFTSRPASIHRKACRKLLPACMRMRVTPFRTCGLPFSSTRSGLPGSITSPPSGISFCGVCRETRPSSNWRQVMVSSVCWRRKSGPTFEWKAWTSARRRWPLPIVCWRFPDTEIE